MPDVSFYDLVVLGSGTAGSTIAKICRQTGRSVAIIDTGLFGGTCALRGCEPKKVLWTLANAADHAQRMAVVGLSGGADVSIDWGALQRFKHSFTDPVPQQTKQQFQSLGIEALHGTPRFASPNTIEINERLLQAERIVIATGARPLTLPIDGESLLATSDDFLALENLPHRIVIVGGGYIAFEIAHIARRGGAEVTIIHQDDRPLAGFDRRLVARLLDESRRVGIRFELGAEVKRVERKDSGFRIIARRDAEDVTFNADLALHAAGRTPNLDGLCLDAAGILQDRPRLKLDQYLRSVSNPVVFAAGDAAQTGPALTPVATIDAKVVAHNLFEECSHEPDYRAVPSSVFAIPPLARVGLTEEEALEKDIKFEIHEGDMADFQSSRRLRQEAAAYRILIEAKTRKLVGAHLLGPGVDEVINLFALAMRLELSADQLGQLVSSYPSFGSNLTAMLG